MKQFIEFISNPIVQQLALAFLLPLVGAVAAYLIQTQPKAAELAQDVADLTEEVEVWVRLAEGRVMTGSSKYSFVLDRAQSWLKAHGIVGRRGRVIQKYLPLIIEATVKKVDPKLGPKKAA